MANPKRRHSQARSAKRRTHYKMVVPGLSRCKQCGALHQPHRACPECGYYKGRKFEQAVIVSQKKE